MNPLVDWLKEPLSKIRIKGLGKKSLEKLGAVDIVNRLDLLRWLPRNYLDYSKVTSISELKEGIHAHVQGKLISTNAGRTPRQKVPFYEGLIDDASGTVRVLWYGMKYLDRTLPRGARVALFGQTAMEYQGLTMVNPRFQVLGANEILEGEIQPVYRTVAGISSEKLRAWIDVLLEEIPEAEWLEERIVSFLQREMGGWVSFKQAMLALHRPEDEHILEDLPIRTNPYRRRLIAEELVLFLHQTEGVRRKVEMPGFPVLQFPTTALPDWSNTLPFQLTEDQTKVLQSFFAKLSSGRRIFSLLQGDVGCGKTIVAVGLAQLFARCGYQSAVLCPTTVLSRQHEQTFKEFLEDTGLRWAQLSSDLDRASQLQILQDLENGEIQIVIGTHRILQGDVFFKNLGLIVIDEQHRFGVQQRLQLLKKGKRPHFLSLTATPIPRSLAHSVYGGYDIQQIRQKPAGRQDVHTILKKTENRHEIIPFLRQRLDCGDQIYWVFPYIEGEDEELLNRSVEAMYDDLTKNFFPDVAVGKVHGRMDREEMRTTMEEFRKGNLQILFSTSVIEVGVDVANATVMVIEAAQQFGLSQLHQLRGRVGRGQKKGYCILFLEPPLSRETLSRTRFFESCHDGFELAEFDLKQRGSGELFGNRQTGRGALRFADLWMDRQLFGRMQDEVSPLLKEDDELLLAMRSMVLEP